MSMTHYSLLRKKLSVLGFDEAVFDGRYLDAANLLNHHPDFHQSLTRTDILRHNYQFAPRIPSSGFVEPLCVKDTYYLALCLIFSIGHNSDDRLALRLMKRVVRHGDSVYQREALVWLGLMALVGRGAHGQDMLAADQEAFAWFQKGMELKHADAVFYLGLMYQEGRGVGEIEKSLSQQKALLYFIEAAACGHLDACSALGTIYHQQMKLLSGRSTQHLQAALSWFTKAADGGHAEAQNNLGVMYLMGDVLDADSNSSTDKKAFFYFSKAANQLLPVACFNLAWMYQQGRGVPGGNSYINDLHAVTWFTNASAYGHEEALRELAWMHEQGRGVANGRCLENHIIAVLWYRRYARARFASFGWFQQKSHYVGNIKIDKVISYADKSLSTDPAILFGALIKAPEEALSLILEDIERILQIDDPFMQALFESFHHLKFYERWLSSEIALRYVEKVIFFLKHYDFKQLLANRYFYHLLGLLGDSQKKPLLLFSQLSSDSANQLVWMLHDVAYANQGNPDPFGRGLNQVITRNLFFATEQCIGLLTRDTRYLLANFCINIIGWQQSLSMRLDSGVPQNEQLLSLLSYARHYYKTPKLAEREWCAIIEYKMESLGIQLLSAPKKKMVELNEIDLIASPVTKKRRL